jgi:hypothetical protein
MGQDAKCIQKNAQDRAIILNPRAFYAQPFLAPDWTDLRLGFFLSLCGNADPAEDDVTTGLDDSIPNIVNGPLGSFDRYWLGVLDTVDGQTFAGFTNVGSRIPDREGDSTLVASDAGTGTGTAFWRPGNSSNGRFNAAIFDHTRKLTAPNVDNLQQHFPQDAGTVAAGYAVLLGLQLTRDNATSKNITMRIKSTTHSADMLFSNTPTKELIHSSLDPWPASVQLGPVTVANVPSAFYFYWPWHNSRLRVHSIGLLRAA